MGGKSNNPVFKNLVLESNSRVECAIRTKTKTIMTRVVNTSRWRSMPTSQSVKVHERLISRPPVKRAVPFIECTLRQLVRRKLLILKQRQRFAATRKCSFSAQNDRQVLSVIV